MGHTPELPCQLTSSMETQAEVREEDLRDVGALPLLPRDSVTQVPVPVVAAAPALSRLLKPLPS